MLVRKVVKAFTMKGAVALAIEEVVRSSIAPRQVWPSHTCVKLDLV